MEPCDNFVRRLSPHPLLFMIRRVKVAELDLAV
jgi:hypothetical protein